MNHLQRLTTPGRALLTALLLLASGLATAGEVTLYYHLDALGSPVAATDEQGNVKWREEYKPYGERINQEATAQANRRWYTGHPHDEATGLTYMGARYYDPVVGRFMAVDSVSFQEQNAINTFNRYAYAANSPYRYVDKDGKCYSSGDIESYMGPDLLDCYVGEGGELLSLGTGVYGVARVATAVGSKTLRVVGREVAESTAENAARITARESGILRDAARGKGNFGLGSATRAEADRIGKTWVGDGHKVASDGGTLISRDGLRQYRPPSAKPNSRYATTGNQANLERRFKPEGQWQGNGHIDIVD